MSAYLIVDLAVHDRQTFARYRDLVLPLVTKHGGEYLVRSGALETIEGNWQPERLVVIEFPHRAAARAFLDDPEYAPVAKLRFDSARSNMILAEGM